MAGQDKTEKATPKRRDEARKKGQVARSADLSGAAVVLVSLLVIRAVGPSIVERLQEVMRGSLTLAGSPEVVDRPGLARLLAGAGGAVALAVGPLTFACLVAGVSTTVLQVRWKPSVQALTPNFKRLNPAQGIKNLAGPRGIFETGKTLVKVAIVGAIAALAVAPDLQELGALVGLAPAELGARLAGTVLDIALRAAAAYFVIGCVDYAWQRYQHEKSLRMDKQEVKEEFKQQQLPPEVRAAQRRRARAATQSRMMAAVPTADVVVTNPTHYAVALRYDAAKPAPEVVAKGRDLIAAKIRELAADARVPIVEDPPLARSLHAAVEVGQMIPESLFQAVAELLAFVYRTARRRALAGAGAR